MSNNHRIVAFDTKTNTVLMMEGLRRHSYMDGEYTDAEVVECYEALKADSRYLFVGVFSFAKALKVRDAMHRRLVLGC